MTGFEPRTSGVGSNRKLNSVEIAFTLQSVTLSKAFAS